VLTLLLCGGAAIASFPAAAALVFAMVRLTAHLETTAGVHRLCRVDGQEGVARRSRWRAEPWWWPEFEREFAAYVQAADGRRS
jgi:hypothetical protein